jgi:2-polyprenyl-3-methyl-5-hydroxy-6-metoxy-1,4-benzoquinol methylase
MSTSSYDDLAEIYDHFQKDINPVRWAKYIDGLVRAFGPNKGDGREGRLLLCDLGCGTGGVSIALHRLGYDVIGIDDSILMLQKAREKAASARADILYLKQNITKMELFGTVDVFCCLLDTVNHLTRKVDFSRMLTSFANYLNPGGLFIFDVATAHHLEDTLGDHFFYKVEEEYALLWGNRFSPKTKISTSDLTFFRKESDRDSYLRYEGQIRERVYTKQDIRTCLEKAGMILLAQYKELSRENTDGLGIRDFYVAMRPMPA